MRLPIALALALILPLAIAHLVKATVVIVEVPDNDSSPVSVARIIDGDTVELNDGSRVRLVGYDAWELNDNLGPAARDFLTMLCLSRPTNLDIDDLEPMDRYGRLLGYLWCGREFVVDNATYVAHAPVAKAFLILRPDLVKRTLYIPPDEHPYWTWTTKHVIRFSEQANIVVINTTSVVSGKVFRLYTDSVIVTGGVYEVYVDGVLVARVRAMEPMGKEYIVQVTPRRPGPLRLLNVMGDLRVGQVGKLILTLENPGGVGRLVAVSLWGHGVENTTVTLDLGLPAKSKINITIALRPILGGILNVKATVHYVGENGGNYWDSFPVLVKVKVKVTIYLTLVNGTVLGKVEEWVLPNETVAPPLTLNLSKWTRAVFRQWEGGGHFPLKAIVANRNIELAAIYGLQHGVSVVDPLGINNVEDWVDEGSYVTISARPVYLGNGTRLAPMLNCPQLYINANISIIVNKPINCNVVYIRQYMIKIMSMDKVYSISQWVNERSVFRIKEWVPEKMVRDGTMFTDPRPLNCPLEFTVAGPMDCLVTWNTKYLIKVVVNLANGTKRIVDLWVLEGSRLGPRDLEEALGIRVGFVKDVHGNLLGEFLVNGPMELLVTEEANAPWPIHLILAAVAAAAIAYTALRLALRVPKMTRR